MTGGLASALAERPAELFDEAGAPEVQLGLDDAVLEEADDRALDAGANLALVGDELVQFGRAEPLGGGRWRLGRLLRGRRGTVPTAHPPGTRFALLGNARVVDLPLSSVGGRVLLMAQGPGDVEPASATVTVTGESVLPPAPVHLRWAPAADGGGVLGWVRRSRVGWSWVDGADAPLGEEREAYLVTLAGGGVSRTAEVAGPRLTVTAAEWAGGPLRAEVRQMGVAGAGRAAVLVF